MASVLGAGAAYATTWLLDPVTTIRARTADDGPPPVTPLAKTPPADLPETVDVLERIVWLLGTASPGLALADFRTLLSEPSEAVQRALALGLRTKRLRRVGAHNKLRYVLNA